MIEIDFHDNFVKLHWCKIELHEHIDDDDIFLYPTQDVCYILNLKNYNINERFRYNVNIKNTYESCLRFTKYSCDSIIFPFLNINHPYKNIDIFNDMYLNNQFRSNNYLQANFITRIEKIYTEYYIVHYGNKKILNRLIEQKKDYKTNIFMNVLNESIRLDIIKNCETELNTILNVQVKYHPVGPNLLIHELNDNIHLYEYQKNDIIWMNAIQNNIDLNINTITINESSSHKRLLDNQNYLICHRQNSIIQSNSPTLCTYPSTITYYGGNIISEVGLGKTLIILSHILHKNVNEFNNFVDFEDKLCNYFYKRGKQKMTSCIKQKITQLYCKEHSNTVFIDKRNIVFKNLEQFNLRDYIITIRNKYGCETQYFKTNASLILCPNQLCDQWVREYYDKFKQDSTYAKRVLLIVTHDQYKNLTFGDILFADLIIISYNFLSNKNYLHNYYSRKNIIDILDEIDKQDDINSIQDILYSHDTKLKVFDYYHYKGIYFDEYHEIMNYSKSNNINFMMKCLKSTYKWNISATPFNNGIASFIYGMSYISDYVGDLEQIWSLNKQCINDLTPLFRRNTRQSIQQEFNGNVINETIKLLDFTEQERSIYDAHHLQGNVKHNRDFLIKLCCDTSIDSETRHLVKNCKTLDEIQKVILEHNKKKLNTLSTKMKDHKDKIDYLLFIVDRGFIIDETDSEGDIFENIDRVKIEISVYRRKLTNDKKEYDIIHKTYTFLKNAIDNINETDTCPICLDDIENDQIAITKCGHKFCNDCINEFINEMAKTSQVKCPKCNGHINTSEIFLLLQNSPQKNIHLTELSSLINEYNSTKIGNILYYIKTNFQNGDKCILFSQWDKMLTKVGNILQQNNINVLYCTGTIYQKKQAITRFQNDNNYNIICLSSEHCASGINLTSANKIILMEPIYGSKDYRKDIENQAIGRADRIGQKRPIEIIRFIIKNTIEEEILNENLL
jgi:SNF2 family DNA or RNA helicase